MTKLLAICRNTFVQTIRQPIFIVLILVTFMFLVLNVPLSTWTMSPTGEHEESDQRLMNNVSLSTILAAGLLVAAFSASSVVSREIDDRTALTVMAKPVTRATFVLGKFAGVAAAVTLAFYLCTLVFLMAVRHHVVPAASDPMDWPVIVIGCSMLAAGILAAVVGNYVFAWPFTSTVVWSVTICLSAAMGVIAVVGKGWELVPFGEGIGGQILIALGLLYVAVLFFTAVAVTASTRLGQLATLVVCVAVALLGAYHPLLFGEWTADNAVLRTLGRAMPDTRYFLMMDALTLKHAVPLKFVGLSVAYGACFIAATLAIGIAVFQTRQLEGRETTGRAPAAVTAMAWCGRAAAVACLLVSIVLPAWPVHRTVDGLATAGGLLAGGVLGWMLWGFFARGAAWSYWLVGASSAIVGLLAAAVLALPKQFETSRATLGETSLSIGALVAGMVVLICLLPRTRRHFRKSRSQLAR
ncbi:MAG: ABC transporter permease [Planctomycetota bacterium]|jgi:hypothetical protein